MRLRFWVLLFLVGFGLLTTWGLRSPSTVTEVRFEAHEFALFRSEYDSLRVQSPAKRVEHFRDLLDATETAKMTSAMAETLAGFCRTVVASPEEASAVKDEAVLVLRSLESRLPARVPASVGK